MMRKGHPNLSEKGMALVVTLLVTAVLVVLITEIVYAVHNYTSMTALFVDSQKASLLASGAVEREVISLSALTRDMKYTYLTEEAMKKESAEEGVRIGIALEDEQGKISLNSLVSKEGKLNQPGYDMYQRFLSSLGLDKDLADAVVDWIDADGSPLQDGAESSDYYSVLDRPYNAKNGKLDSIEELLLVKGYTIDVYKRLKPFITVSTDGKVNVNTAPKEVIMALASDITEEMADTLIEERDKKPFASTAEVRNVPGFGSMPVGFENSITVKSNTMRIRSKAASGDIFREIDAVVRLGDKPITLYWRER
ncbi:MAG: type II secretion system minor pseudopilin GspK [Deltaproteobacteria bacterium]|nr:type II secretion system minor pseudopilin GspK [Deltaproteobacteria bacterium]